MVLLFTCVVVFLVSNAFLTFDEETLIICATLFWFDAAGGLFKKMLEGELVTKVDLVRSKFIWFLTLKQQLLVDLLRLHTSRFALESSLVLVNSVFVTSLIEEGVNLFLTTATLRRKFIAYSWVSTVGTVVYYERLISDLEQTLSLASFSGIAIGLVSSDKPSFSFGAYSSLSHTLA